MDFTEGIAAYYDLKPQLQADKAKLVADIGGGADDAITEWAKNNIGIERVVFDPFARPHEHNEAVMKRVRGGKADAVVSNGVFNIVEAQSGRLAHIATVFDALKLGGKAFFSVWAGNPDVRGSGKPTREFYKDEDAEVKAGTKKAGDEKKFQWNKYADEFVSEVELVFGAGAATVNKDKTRITAIKSRAEPGPSPVDKDAGGS